MTIEEDSDFEASFQPTFIRPACGIPCYGLLEAARLMTPFGQDPVKRRNQLKGLIRSRLIDTCQQGVGNAMVHKLRIDDVATALVLASLYDYGLSDVATIQAASLGLRGWNMTNNPRPSDLPDAPSPIVAALVEAPQRPNWIFRMMSLHHDQTNERRIVAQVYDMERTPVNPTRLPAAFIPGVTVTMLLSPLLLPLSKKLQSPSGN